MIRAFEAFAVNRVRARWFVPCALVVLASGCLSGNSQSGDSTPVSPGDSCSADRSTAPSEDGCNTCVCSGSHWVCTEVACALDAGQGVCKDGETKPSPDGCNTCACSSGQWLCTQRACAPDAGTICTDGQTKMADDGCNTCTCSGGQWGCTLLGCPQCPAPVTSDQTCASVVVYAQDPVSGMCCEYGSPCSAPSDWVQYYSTAECEGAASNLQWFTTCGAPVCGPNTDQPTGESACTGQQTEGSSCTSEGLLCDPGTGCGTNLICASSDPKTGPSGCPISRARFKQDIEYVDAAERARLADKILSLPLATYRYRHSDGRSHLGFIIEDVEPSMSVDAARDRVDLYGYTSMAVAALQEQQEELRVLRAEVAALKAAVGDRGAVCQ